MNTTVRKFAVGLASTALVASAAAPAFAAVTDANRIAGEDRYDTAIAEATKIGSATNVVLANGEDAHLVDAITGGKIAGAPVLFVNNEDKDVQAKVKAQILKFGSLAKVYVLGGTDTVSDDTVKAVVPSAVYEAANKVERLGGETRYDTAAAIAKVVKAQSTPNVAKDTVYLANGVTKVDALVAGQIKDSGQILLTDGSGKLPKATLDYIKATQPSKVVALGGTTAVTAAELEEARAAVQVTQEEKDEAVKAALEDVAKANNALDGYLTVDSSQVAVKTADLYVEYASALQGTAPTAITVIGFTAPDGSDLPTLTTWASGGIDSANEVKELAKSQFPKVAPNLTDTAGSAAIYKNQFGTGTAAQAALSGLLAAALDPAETNDGRTTTIYGGPVVVNAYWNTTSTGALPKALAAWNSGDTLDDLTDYASNTTLGTALSAAITNAQDFTETLDSTSPGASKALWDAIKDFYPTAAPLSVATASNGTVKLDNTSTADLAKVTGKELIAALAPGMEYQSTSGNGGKLTGTSAGQAIVEIAAKVKTQLTDVVGKAAKDAYKTWAEDITALDKALKAYKDAEALTVNSTSVATERVAGDDRYATSVKIAQRAYPTLSTVTKVYLANGYALADAAVSGYVDNVTTPGAIAGPVLLVETDKVPTSADEFIKKIGEKITTLGDSNVIAFGGKTVVADATIEAAQKTLIG